MNKTVISTRPSHLPERRPRLPHEEAILRAKHLAESLTLDLHKALGCRPGELLDMHLKNADEATQRLQRAVNVARGEARGSL